MNKKASSREFIIAPDGTLYHLDLKRADHIPHNLILVGASDRVDTIASHFDEVTFTHTNASRPEFHAAFGRYKGVPVGAVSVGIGTPSMEIACNELHALFEYDHMRDVWEKPAKPINIIRLGTAGTSLKDIPLGAYAISQYSLGLDNVGVYYPVAQDAKSKELLKALHATKFGVINQALYVAPAYPKVVSILKQEALKAGAGHVVQGLTTSSPGFFASEGRRVGRLTTAFTLEEFIHEVETFSFQDMRIVSHEMETSILFRLMYEQLGYHVGALCVILDNVASNEVIAKEEYTQRMEGAIRVALESLVKLSK